MDWRLAVEENGKALRRVLAGLVAMAGFSLRGAAGGAAGPQNPKTLPRRLHRAVLRLLRPAESAARRLVVIAARGLVVTPPPPAEPALGPAKGRAPTSAPPKPAFALFDRLRLPARRRPPAPGVPRLSVPGYTVPFPLPRPPGPDDPVDAAPLLLRLGALSHALENLPGAARRFARWQARRDAERARRTEIPDAGRGLDGRDLRAGRRRFRRLVALRPGRPPGSSRRGRHEIHAVLAELHGLAVWALEAPDTS